MEKSSSSSSSSTVSSSPLTKFSHHIKTFIHGIQLKSLQSNISDIIITNDITRIGRHVDLVDTCINHPSISCMYLYNDPYSFTFISM